MAKKVFIAATKQNDGKTTVSLGLIANLQAKFKKVGFIKPIGQRYLEDEGQQIDEDSILVEKVCGLKGILKDMSPVAVERGFTERYIASPNPQAITRKIKDSFQRLSRGQGFMVIEGTGHAGVGSVFDHSNSYVARILGAKVILISSGGVGRPIDEIILNKALFDNDKVKLMGVIVNKVLPDKFDKVAKTVRQGLKRKGIDVLGVIPYSPVLSEPTMGQIMEETEFKLFCGAESLNNHISNIIIGAMDPADAVKYLKPKSLLIVPGDREDLLISFLTFKDDVSGVVITGAIEPSFAITEVLKKSGVPVLFARDDTYKVASVIHDLTVKIGPRDKDKINAAIDIVKKYVDIDTILKRL